MSEELFQKKYDRLLQKISKLRAHQSAYEQYRSSDDREKAKRLAREVDQLILQEARQKKSGQKELF